MTILRSTSLRILTAMAMVVIVSGCKTHSVMHHCTVRSPADDWTLYEGPKHQRCASVLLCDSTLSNRFWWAVLPGGQYGKNFDTRAEAIAYVEQYCKVD